MNFESIQQLTQSTQLHLLQNHLLSSIDFTQLDDSKSIMNSLQEINFRLMNLTYTIHNNNCLDLNFLKFMPNVERLSLSDNKIECIDNLSILQRKDVKIRHLDLTNNSLASFDFGDLIGSNLSDIRLGLNYLSSKSVKNFDKNTLIKISPGKSLAIRITPGNDLYGKLYFGHDVIIW